jgi:hypothetical protein
MCIADAPQQPKTPEPPAPAAAPVENVEPELGVKRGKSRAQSIQGKRRYRVDLTTSSPKKTLNAGTGLNIPT